MRPECCPYSQYVIRPERRPPPSCFPAQVALSLRFQILRQASKPEQILGKNYVHPSKPLCQSSAKSDAQTNSQTKSVHLGIFNVFEFKWSNKVSTPWDFQCFWPSNVQTESVHLRMFIVCSAQKIKKSQYALGCSMLLTFK